MRVFGKNTCLEILNSKQKVNKVYVQKSVDEKFKETVLKLYKNVHFVEKDFFSFR